MFPKRSKNEGTLKCISTARAFGVIPKFSGVLNSLQRQS